MYRLFASLISADKPHTPSSPPKAATGGINSVSKLQLSQCLPSDRDGLYEHAHEDTPETRFVWPMRGAVPEGQSDCSFTIALRIQYAPDVSSATEITQSILQIPGVTANLMHIYYIHKTGNIWFTDGVVTMFTNIHSSSGHNPYVIWTGHSSEQMISIDGTIRKSTTNKIKNKNQCVSKIHGMPRAIVRLNNKSFRISELSIYGSHVLPSK